jgi:hypothetical protein
MGIPVTFLKRKNAMLYWNKGKRRGHRAVASHSKSDPYNLDAISRYIPNEIGMHHIARKHLILPCGWTVKESWAALRKSWLGFMIAHGNGDIAKMKHYATFIHKVQHEMGIGLTVFDDGLLDDQDMTTSMVPSDTDNAKGQIFAVTDKSTQNDEDESLPDFEEIMSNGPNIVAVPDPREEIFVAYEDRSQNSCEYTNKKANKTPTNGTIRNRREETFVTYEDRTQSSCEYEYDLAKKSKVNAEKRKIYPEKSCWNDPDPINRKLKKEKKRQFHSCFYKSNGPSGSDKVSSQVT